LLQSGLTPAEIADRRGIALSTVESHIAKLIENGADIDWHDFVPADTIPLLDKLFADHDTDSLVPIVEASRGLVTFGQARIFRAARQLAE
jgi:ATP-dependent DNA helicase RecQ